MANKSDLSQELIDIVSEVYRDCVFDKQCRNILMRRGFYVEKKTWEVWKAQGEDLLFNKPEEERTEHENLLVRFYLALCIAGSHVEETCLNNIRDQLTNPKNAEFNWRVLKLRNRKDGEYDEKTITENNVNVSGNINVSLMDAIKEAKLREKEHLEGE